MKEFVVCVFLTVATCTSGHGQVLISLLLGDKLNSDNVEFGLDGGVSFVTQRGVDGDVWTTFNLGFYFNFSLDDAWFLHTGVIVKSPMGEAGIQPYSIGDPQLDDLLIDSEVTRKLGYFHVPVLLQRRFKERYFVEAGPQLGLRHSATDLFETKTETGDDLQFDHDISDDVKVLDAGVVLGAGYRFRAGKSMSLGCRWYAGLLNVFKDGKGYNNSVTIFASIPIGAGNAKNQNINQ